VQTVLQAILFISPNTKRFITIPERIGEGQRRGEGGTYVRFILRERSLRARKEEREKERDGKRGREKVVDFLINLREKEREKVL